MNRLNDAIEQGDLCDPTPKYLKDEVEQKQIWFFTFGSAHAHPNGYVKIQGNFSDARAKMFERFDSKWAMQYNEKDFAGQAERYGLHEVLL